MSGPRADYPRPRFVRERWLSLNGPWAFAFDPGGSATPSSAVLDREIVVPFAPEWPASGIGDAGPHTVVWYRRAFEVPSDWGNEHVWLRFGAVDHACQVWVNEVLVGTHEGGHTPFGFDVTRALRSGSNTLLVRAVDDWKDITLPRGKQTWREEPRSIFYTRTTGIWQSVWLEPLPQKHVVDVHLSSSGPRARFEIELSASSEVDVDVEGRTMRASGRASGRSIVLEADLGDAPRWSPDDPHLIDVEVRCGSDRVRTYIGMRDITVDGTTVRIDGRPIVQRLVLDQGYWPDGGLTAPTDEAIAEDVAWIKQLGFDGARKHQKVEDPIWLHHCDRAGVLVWAEMANAYAFTPDAARRLGAEWQAAVRRDRSHPCVVTWVPINESWGIPEIRSDARQQAFARSLYHLTHSLDVTRPCVDNDGWEHTEDTDLLTIHDYSATGAELDRPWADGLPTGTHRPPLVDGATYRGQPVLITEYGGISYHPGEPPEGGWGYGETEPSERAFLDRYRGLTAALASDRRLAGWCYTQLTDVQQETNGLLTFDRRPKAAPAAIAEITRIRG